jgi:hypothetical protein
MRGLSWESLNIDLCFIIVNSINLTSLRLEKTLMPDYADKGSKKRFVLPFATLGANRFRDFTKNMEMAAILYLAESGREKGESRLLKKTDEKIVFVAEACYPIWLIPYNTATLMFDGLGLASHTLSYDVTPDVEIFSKDVRRHRKTTGAYTAALIRNTDYFRNFKGREEIKIEGLITAPDLREDFKNYLPRMRELRRPFATRVALTPTVEGHEIRAGVRQLSNLRRRISKDIESMNASMKLLNTATSRSVRVIREEIRKTQVKYHRQIKKTKLISARRMLQIQGQYNRKTTRICKGFKRRLLRLNKNQAKLRKTLRHLRGEARGCEIKVQSSRRRKRRQAEHQWTLRLERIKKKVSTLRRGIEVNSKRIRDVENAQRLELAKLRTECWTRIESANRMFRNLQGSKQAEIAMKRQEIVALEDVTRCITKSMLEMVQKEKVFHAEFDRIAMPRGKRMRRLVYVPFYLVRYQKGDKKRYVVYPPLVVGDMGILTRMKGALGAAKVKALLQSRSEAMAAFLNQLLVLIEKKPMLEKNLTEAGIQNSVLLRRKLRVGVKNGLKELEKENWISKSELRAFSRILYMYASSIRRTKAMLISENDYLECLPA